MGKTKENENKVIFFEQIPVETFYMTRYIESKNGKYKDKEVVEFDARRPTATDMVRGMLNDELRQLNGEEVLDIYYAFGDWFFHIDTDEFKISYYLSKKDDGDKDQDEALDGFSDWRKEYYSIYC